MMPKVAVCLSGCGFLDGAEIHEAAQTLLALDQARAKVVICAPDVAQTSVVDHRTQKPAAGQARNVLTESARIARGKIVDVAEVRADQIDALIFPGGFGAASTLCTFAKDGPDCQVNPDVERLINEMADAGKPIGAACIAPALLARVLGRRMPATLTIGNEAGVAKAIERMGCRHQNCRPGGHVVDEQHRLVTTPAFMYGDSGPAKVFEGIQGLVQAVLRLAAATR
jgi:enhancing lycopene biosynthesis protein 2